VGVQRGVATLGEEKAGRVVDRLVSGL